MSDTSTAPGRRPVVTPPRVLAALCLIAPFVGMLWVGSYAKVEPTFIGIPFFYWYQMLWVPVSAALTSVAYVLVRREQRARKGGDGA
ncbi:MULTISPECIES: DUF3311 domain-containing protein [Streptomyces]|uniref:Membrane protein implicated in regulation of membrane protease activity n=2 Tax=Streptomyces TaxID=1883 RepID=A0ABT9KYB5_9ACTN|nr:MULTISPECIES: DUF3311 domain-containing protein [Streptomyces]MBW8092352.1 DUF3311 domain-containing protein [Streptomyces hygroscopicus subsp. hygroscopicus]MCO8303955.1 DUF3311 domain-containing protein [Streptomyces sp. RKCA744]MDN3053385.1 DUF3311 domain-containing protein [Streptomyces sp. SRF1]MDP9613422.1 membrane protein implicated in regulation of membrane protease activity [Streptomyces demainii]